ncbi:MBL fold metallo-hydrolase [Brevibacterium sp. BRM-1]|uniref:MBL fold metallo-hydrolase n=1 Tax=Brevibacterium sp. BRM-1 TaxID=2999062 RepID=UPI0022814F5F|nr:MBL fold metallo-hydrolase [Brevibacterium sp. BRM-1]WAL40257.1 MBL fold metallo-hydrolase [Brevibacterium sp. BRM-1]
MRLTAIGTSGSFPGPASAASCYLVEHAEAGRTWRIVLDLGSGALGPLQTVCAVGEIDAVVLSHLHPDHCLDITGLYVARSYDPARPAGSAIPRIPVWAPADAAERLSAAYHTEAGRSPVASEYHATDLGSVFDFHELGPRAAFSIGPLAFTAHLVDHPVEAYALRIGAPDGAVLAYSGDSDECAELTAAAAGAALFLCEAAFEEDRDTVRGIHLTGRRAGRTARAAGAQALVLTHVPPWTRAQTVAAEAAAEFSGPIEIAAPAAAWDL